jgi:hypothetical protein
MFAPSHFPWLGVEGDEDAKKDLTGKSTWNMLLMSKIKPYLCLKSTREEFF